MGNCIRTEMWKAFHNKMMRSALLIGFILVIADLVQTAITVSDLGASYAHSPGGYDGCSLFVNWIGVNGVTVGAVVFYAVWPFLAAMPYGWSLYEDNRSHMTNNILTRVPYSQYKAAFLPAGASTAYMWLPATVFPPSEQRGCFALQTWSRVRVRAPYTGSDRCFAKT